MPNSVLMYLYNTDVVDVGEKNNAHRVLVGEMKEDTTCRTYA
jgi:hypothetical protein